MLGHAVLDQLVDGWTRSGEREVGSCRASGCAALTESYWEDVHAVMGLLTTALAPASSGSAAASAHAAWDHVC